MTFKTYKEAYKYAATLSIVTSITIVDSGIKVVGVN